MTLTEEWYENKTRTNQGTVIRRNARDEAIYAFLK